MQKITSFILIVFLSTTIMGQSSTDARDVKATIATLFKGLHTGDSILVSSVLHQNIKIQTTGKDKEGKSFLKDEDKLQFLKSIASKKPSDSYLERLLSFTISIDGNLASVWTPYEFYINGNLNHCGANSFQLYNNDGKWEIIYLIDTRKVEGCVPPEK